MSRQRKVDKGFLRQVIYSFTTRGIAAFGTLTLNLVMARYTSAIELGNFMLGLSMIVGLGILARFGMDNAVLRFGGIAYKNRNRARFSGIQKQAINVTLILSLFLSAILIVNSEFISKTIFNNSKLEKLLYVMAAILPVYSMLYLQGAWLKSLRRPAYAPMFETGAVAFLTSFLIIVCANFGYEISAITTAYYLLFSTISVLFVGHVVINRFLKVSFDEFESKPIYQSNLLTVLPDFVLIAITAYVVQWGSLLMLGVFVDSSQVGVYSTVHRIAYSVNFILMVFNNVLAPRFASLYANGEQEKLSDLVKKSTLQMMIFSFPITMLLMIFPGFVLSIFGNEFVSASPLLTILVCAQFVNVSTGSVGFVLNMTGHQREMRNIVLFTGSLSVLLAIVVIPIYGIWGALISNVTSLVVQNLTAAYMVHKLLGIRTIPGWDAIYKSLQLRETRRNMKK